MPNLRNRSFYVFLIIFTIGLGLVSRINLVPKLFYPFLGDILYTLMIFFITGFLFPKLSSFKVALISISFCFSVEISQLYQANWINEIRSYKLGGLILGYGFLWNDLISYLIGGIIGFCLEFFIFKKIKGVQKNNQTLN